MMTTYAVVYERTENNYAAYVPDLPGCVATGRTKHEVERRIRAAIQLHLEGMLEDGQKPPAPTTTTDSVEIGI
jgi:predicted RNase H-like HicB family nuclease